MKKFGTVGGTVGRAHGLSSNAVISSWILYLILSTSKRQGASLGLVVVGGDSCLRSCVFEVQHWILGG